MEARANNATDLFLGNHRYYVPAYQRAYVWTEEKQWSPLWEDISRLADGSLDGKADIHFLGAVVIRLEDKSPGQVTSWSVIDGQQRLTTLQLLMSALAQAAEEDGVSDTAVLLHELLAFKEQIAQGDERFRFWPTTVNQDSYRAVMEHGGLEPEREDDAANTIEEAWEFFRERARDYARNAGGDESEYGADPAEALKTRYGALYQAVTAQLQLVSISLDPEDPAQVIFETLNARGTPLLAIELVKNALLDKARGEGLDPEAAYVKHWADQLGDDAYWSEEERLGRGIATRAEAFLYYWMAMKLGELVPADGLFDRFRREFVASSTSEPATAVMDEINADAALYRSLGDLDPATAAGAFMGITEMVETNVFYPVTMALMKADLSDARRSNALGALGSYLVRRMVCGLQTRSYGTIAVSLADEIRRNPSTADEEIVSFLLSSEGDSARWPTDDEITRRLREQPIYGWLGRSRLSAMLGQVELFMRSGSKTEDISALPTNLALEHIMPQAWARNWPLEPGASDEAAELRESKIHLIGNLTLITGSLNSSLSNGPWKDKRAALADHSILMLKKELVAVDVWDEGSIDDRGQRLVDAIITMWPGPQRFIPEDWMKPNSESWPDNKILNSDELSAVFNTGTPYLRTLLADLAERPDERRKYPQIEKDLGWPVGRLRGVFGGYRQRFPQFKQRRPFALHFDADGNWWMWQTAEQAEHTRAAITESGTGVTTMEGLRDKIELPEVRALVDDLPSQFGSAGAGWKASVKPEGSASVRLNSPNTGAFGYFAKQWLFLWMRDRFVGDEDWYSSRLSKPDEVSVDAYERLRLHVANEADLAVVIEGLVQTERELGTE